MTTMDNKFLIYNGMDACATYQIWEEFWPEMTVDSNMYNTYRFTMRLVEPLLYMMNRGILVNSEALSKAAFDIESDIAEKQAKLDAMCGRPLNVNSSKDCQAYFYGTKRVRPYTKINAKGDSVITTDDAAMARMARGWAKSAGIPEAALVQEIRGMKKLKSTYLDIVVDPDKRFRSFCNPRGTRMGRISTSKTFENTGMNMQNLTERFKSYLIPDPGMMMISFDKRQAEWIVVAYQSGDANMIKIISEGRDVHAATGSMMYGVSEEIVKLEDQAVKHETDPNVIRGLRQQIPELAGLHGLPRSMSIRQAGKKSNHGLNYDEGVYMFALTNEIIQAEAKIMIDKYHAIYPGIRHNHAAIQTMLRKDRCLTNCFGRKYHFLDDWGPNLFKSAYAFIPQSTIPDLLNLGIMEIYESEDSYLKRGELLAQVHDEALYQFPLDLGAPGLGYIIRVIAEDIFNPIMEYGGRSFQIPTDVKVSLHNWSDMTKLELDDNLTKQLEEILQ